ncbi:MAG: pyruvate ferredoxin oxidoreductase [Deltaproteobacteria bacterium]|uniref:Pyruvate ferredoxin oxidoreductase n=1 Tax=Candidatus Zymogenus saltonus TaxID=2844893 RepID=A0A9D8KE12_9DELT|nr:pyruvate ferredoxin oxidoreductase [Candidatus Zymogenus saltonus]
MKMLMEGNHAVSWGVMLSRVQVLPVYPITPQTHISEALADFVAEGRLDARYIKVESEHSAMAACIGASTANARAFTATSSQGLALMHEMLHWAAGARLPIVMANVNRAIGSPWNIWNDQSDSMSQRDTGWLQFYAEDNQECLDSIILAYMVSEAVLVPSMVVLDAFILSHTQEAVEIPEAGDVDAILPTLANPNAIDIDVPRAYSPVVAPDNFTEVKYKQYRASEDAIKTIEEAGAKFKDAFGRDYPLVSPYMMDDAKAVLVAAGAVTGTVRKAVDALRREGKKAGMLKIRTFRPFPRDRVREVLQGVPNVGVLDKSVFPGAGGPIAQEVRASLYYSGKSNGGTPRVTGFVGGLGGRDITVSDVAHAFETIMKGKGTDDPIFLGLKK